MEGYFHDGNGRVDAVALREAAAIIGFARRSQSFTNGPLNDIEREKTETHVTTGHRTGYKRHPIKALLRTILATPPCHRHH